MKKIFIVSSGSYSDYHIDGIFDDKELAQKYIDAFEKDSYEEMGIEEWDLNPHEKEIRKGCRPYFLRISRDGEVSDIEIEDSSYGFREQDDRYGFAIDNSLYFHVFAKDEKHAIKSISDKRAYLLANNLWGKKV